MRVEPSYAELMRENKRLRAALTEQSDSSRLTPSPRQIRLVGDHEERLYQVLRGEPRRERISSILQVVFPSRECSTALLVHGARWTCWLQGGIDQNAFETQVDSFFSESTASRFERLAAPGQQAWLGMFFGYMTVSAP